LQSQRGVFFFLTGNEAVGYNKSDGKEGEGGIFVVCRNCGTQTALRVCPHCGMDVVTHEFATPPTPTAGKCGARTAKLHRSPVRFKMIFPETLVLFLPLLFCFMDVFVVMADSLFAAGDGGAPLFRTLFAYLSSERFVTTSAEEMGEAILGSARPWMATYSPLRLLRALLSGGEVAAPLWLPALIICIFAVLSALMGLLLLFSGGKVLRAAPMADLVLLFGAMGAFSPIVALWLPAIGTLLAKGADAANAAMLGNMLSIEAVLLVALLACITPPALASLRRSAARARGVPRFVLLPARALGGCGFSAVKWMTFGVGVLALGAGVLPVLFPVTTAGGVLDLDLTPGHLKETVQLFSKRVCSLDGTRQSMAEFTGVLAELFFMVFVLLLAVLALMLAWYLLRVLLVRREKAGDQPKKKRKPIGVGGGIFRLFSLALVLFGILQAVLLVLWLVRSPLGMRLDLSEVDGTLPLVYLTLLVVRDLCRVTVPYALAVLCAAPLAAFAGDLSRVLRNKAEETL
jgi:hypothetical protein